MTLEELKLENAAAEEAQKEEVETVTPKLDSDSELSDATDDDADVETKEAGELVEEETLDDWMQSDDQASHNNDTVSVGVLAKVRGKLKAKVGERDDEIALLKQELDKLKAGVQPVASPNITRPKREDYYESADPDLAYELAVDDWQDKRFESRQANSQQANKVSARQQQQLANIKTESDAHYKRAEALVSEGKITADAYVKADNAVRGVIEQIFPGHGDSTTDALIAQLSSVGEGSEKVMYYLGNNAKALGSLRDKLSNDPSGLLAMVYLGSLMGKGSIAKTKKISQAPTPASRLSGDDNATNAGKPMHKKYEAAHSAKDTQTAFNIKREARAAGIDTSQW